MKRVFEESWKGVVGESCWREFFEEGFEESWKGVVEESCWREFLKRVLKRVGRELVKKVVEESF